MSAAGGALATMTGWGQGFAGSCGVLLERVNGSDSQNVALTLPVMASIRFFTFA